MTSKEGGWFGWLIVFIGFVYNLVSNGIPLAFGIMIPNIVKESNCTTPQLVTVGAVAFGLNYLPAVLICALTTLIGCRKVATFGGFVCAIACAVSGLVTNCNHLMLTYGLLGGTSFALFNLPGEMMVNMHFHKRRAIAHSIIVCGTPIGILILPHNSNIKCYKCSISVFHHQWNCWNLCPVRILACSTSFTRSRKAYQ